MKYRDSKVDSTNVTWIWSPIDARIASLTGVIGAKYDDDDEVVDVVDVDVVTVVSRNTNNFTSCIIYIKQQIVIFKVVWF